MTESEWLVSDDPQAMLRWMVASGIPAIRHARLTDRKLRLFACAVCRQVWDGKRCGCLCGKVMVRELPPFEPAIEPPTGPVVMPEYRDRLEDCPYCHGTGRVGGLTDLRSRAAVEVSERFADGEATEEELLAASNEATRAATEYQIDFIPAWASHGDIGQGLGNIIRVDNRGWQETTYQGLASLLRCLVGNPFRPVFGNPKQAVVSDGYGGLTTVRGYTCIRPEWLTTAVVNVAAAIYADRDWQALPILADALEDAGCDNADIIGHLRGPGPHARGCWVVDLILGKQ